MAKQIKNWLDLCCKWTTNECRAVKHDPYKDKVCKT